MPVTIMRRLWILVLAIAIGTVANCGHAQTTTTTDAQTKQNKKAQKAQEKADKKAQKDAEKTGKKTTTQQDAAYALAYKNQAPEGHTPAPK
jgi:hypothetical protein